MCRCRERRDRVTFLEAAIREAEWDLRYRAIIEQTERDDPNRRIQLAVAYDLARALGGMLSQRRAAIEAIAAGMAPANVSSGETKETLD